MTTHYIDLADFLAIAEWVLDTPAPPSSPRTVAWSWQSLRSRHRLPPSGTPSSYPSIVEKAAVLCTRIVKNHPLIDGNKRVGFVCMIEFCLRNGLTWTPPPGDEDGAASASVILDLAAGRGDDEAVASLTHWIEERTGLGEYD